MPKTSTERVRRWRANHPDDYRKAKKKYLERVNDKDAVNSRKLWTDAEMRALDEWTGTALAFARLYGRSLKSVEVKRVRIRADSQD